MIIDVVVHPAGDTSESFSLDPSRMDPNGLANARRLLEVLALTGRVTRASTATGRVQTLEADVQSGSRSALVKILGGGDQTLVTIEASQTGAPALRLILHGSASDPVIDEAYGLALHIGAAILGSAVEK